MTTTKQHNETEVGNYFISNYPPFSLWTPENVPDALAALERPPRPDTPLGLYLHVPFCRKRCHFCYFKVYTGKNSAEIRTYLDATLNELRLVAEQPFIGGRPLSFVYFGGGTPSSLSPDQLKYLVSGMQELLPWTGAGEIAFECEPGTLNERKLHFIRELGVTRLSLGVENFDDHILALNGRAHRSREILRAYGWAQDAGFPQINIDLIAGMLDETEDNWMKCVQQAVELAPDSITIYQMEIPYNTTIYEWMKEKATSIAPVADWQTKQRWTKAAFGALEDAGYTISSAYTAVKDPDKTKFLYRDELWQGADLLSLGVASFSHINGVHYQNEHDMDTYMAALEEDRLPIYRALAPTDEELMIREFVLQLKLGHVSKGYFREKFDTDLDTRFAEPLNDLRQRGLLNGDDEVRLTRDGLLQVDRLLPAFFLPQHRETRYA